MSKALWPQKKTRFLVLTLRRIHVPSIQFVQLLVLGFTSCSKYTSCWTQMSFDPPQKLAGLFSIMGHIAYYVWSWCNLYLYLDFVLKWTLTFTEIDKFVLTSSNLKFLSYIVYKVFTLWPFLDTQTTFSYHRPFLITRDVALTIKVDPKPCFESSSCLDFWPVDLHREHRVLALTEVDLHTNF